ncbi:tyrosine-type recombinase/integrase [Haloferax larsenii]|uniref:Integrase/recombinase XerD n=1 Tax=Haloferax larsenii TaxID=302484 RepID=A0A1H7QPJ5_HALLR|nr:tyrosine-type recombinase/integrase [Haloferax larsenii]SEL49931.1 integrase/recombinase XerD [Haloferax larsenii]
MFVDKFLSHTESRKKPDTYKNRKVSLNQFTEYIDSYPIETINDVESYHIEDWIDDLLLDGYARRSIRSKVYDLSAYFAYADNRNWVKQNPVDTVDIKDFKTPEIDKHTKIRYLSIEEFKKLLNVCHKLRDELLVRLIWDTGVRASEAVSIKIEDIDRDNKKISVKNGKRSRDKDHERRDVYYSNALEGLLYRWIDRGERLSYLGVEDKTGHLLVTKQGSRMATTRVSKLVRELAKDAEIQEVLYTDQSGRPRNKVTPHALRHSFAVHRVKKGMPIAYLQDLMGHTEIEVTRDYLKFREDDVRQAAEHYQPDLD